MRTLTAIFCTLTSLFFGLSYAQNNIIVTPAGTMDRAVSGHFAAIVDGKLQTWGGCNFPDVPCADGGQKVFYPKAYGASVVVPEGTVYIGGASPLTPLRGEGKQGSQAITSTTEVTFLPSSSGEGLGEGAVYPPNIYNAFPSGAFCTALQGCRRPASGSSQSFTHSLPLGQSRA